MTERIPMSSPEVDESDISAVAEVIRSRRLALGPKTVEFEQAIAAYVGVKHAIAACNGTAALHLIVRALGLGAGDEILVPSYTFAATINAFLFEGCRPVFVEIDPVTKNVNPFDLEEKITSKTRAIMVVDVFGHPADWDEILRIARKHHLKVIDDSCEALGAEYNGQRIGSFGDAAAFSFYPNKQMTVGEGGVVVTNDDELARLARSLRNQGRGEMGPWLAHERLGYNYRLDEMSAALGVSQLMRLETFLVKRARVAGLYAEHLREIPEVQAPVVKPNVRMSWCLYVVTLASHLHRDPVMAAMEAQGIPTRGYFAPVHLQPYIRQQFGYKEGDLPVTEEIAQRTMALPFHNNLSVGSIEHIVAALGQAVKLEGHGFAQKKV